VKNCGGGKKGTLPRAVDEDCTLWRTMKILILLTRNDQLTQREEWGYFGGETSKKPNTMGKNPIFFTRTREKKRFEGLRFIEEKRRGNGVRMNTEMRSGNHDLIFRAQKQERKHVPFHVNRALREKGEKGYKKYEPFG